MNYIVAVSGGVDSVVLLDMLAKSEHTLIVAHVDHGIRPESSADARFVEALAKGYGLPYRSITLRLGDAASEDEARDARYDFLFKLAHEHKAVIATAHHQDDMIGSVAINLQRGTGWRGLAVLNRSGITRPLLGMTKVQLYEYAIKHRLEWVEDETNHHKKYLRNRLRAGVIHLDSTATRQLVELRQRQLQLAHDIDREVVRVRKVFGDSRHAYTVIDMRVAIELLRQLVRDKTGYHPTVEQAQRVLLAIKTAKPRTAVDVARGIVVRFRAREFVVDTSRKMVE